VLACGLEGSGPVTEGYPVPAPGRAPGATTVSTPAGDVSIANGNLLLDHQDFEVPTRLGVIRVGRTFHSASGSWVGWLDLRYDGWVFVDEHGTIHSVWELEATPWIRVDDQTLQRRGGRLYRFEGGRLSRIEALFPEGPTLELERDPDGRLTRIVQHLEFEPDETVLEVEYEGSVERLESFGRLAERVLDAAGRVTRIRDGVALESGGPPTRYAYDPQGRLAQIEDATGVVTHVRYDEAGRVVGVGRGSEWHHFLYRTRASAQAPFEAVHIDPTGAVTRYAHAGAGRVTWRRDPLGGIWRAAYRGGLRLWSEGPLGDRWSFEYTNGDPVARTDPLGHRESWEPEPGAWNAHAPDVAPWRSFTDSRGAVWTQTFDPYGRPVARTDPLGAKERFEYWGSEVRKVESPDGFEVCLRYDAPHGKRTSVDPGCSGHPQLDLRNATGAPLGDVGGGLRVFDAAGRLREILFPDSGEAGQSRLVFERDGEGRVVESTGPYGGGIRLERDAGGRVVARHELVEPDEDPGTERWLEQTLTRDPSGRVTTRTYPDGDRVDRVRDAAGRVVELRYVDASGRDEAWVRLERDPVGRIVRIDDSREGLTILERDLRGRPRLVRYPRGEWAVQSFDAAGLLTRLALYLPDGSLLREFEWVRDTRGHPVVLFEGDDALLEATLDGRRREIQYANGVRQERTFDGMQRLTRLVLRARDGSPLREFDCSYWLQGLTPTPALMQVVDRTQTGEGSSIAYDEGGRVSGWFGAWTYTLRWDVLGNLHFRDTRAPDGARERLGLRYSLLRTRLEQVGSDEVTHDARGRVTRIGNRRIDWEPFDRPRRLGEIELRYSTLGSPIARTVEGESTQLLFGGLVQTDADLRPIGLELAGLYVDLQTGEHEYLHRDFRNNVAWVTNDDGALAAVRRFGPFGTQELEGNARSARGFAGGEEIGEFVLLGARVYSPRAARFLTRDPNPDWINPYAYAYGDPVNFWDPDGEERRETRTQLDVELAGRPLPYARLRILVEERVHDDPDAEETPPPDRSDGSESSAGSSPDPGLFPETPNTPTIPNILLPPRFGGCDAIAAAPDAVFSLLLLLPLLLLGVRRIG
jgi:RHS repeat-associated protein